MSWQEFWAMGGHAFYVWSSFGTVAAIMIYNAIMPLISHRRLLNDISRQLARKKGSD